MARPKKSEFVPLKKYVCKKCGYSTRKKSHMMKSGDICRQCMNGIDRHKYVDSRRGKDTDNTEQKDLNIHKSV